MWPFRKDLTSLAKSASDKELIKAIRDQSPARLEQFTELQRHVHMVWWLEAESDNGTLEQYFSNTTGNDYPLLLPFLDRIGARETAEVVRRFLQKLDATDAFLDRPERNRRIQALRDQDEPAWEHFVRNLTNQLDATSAKLWQATAAHARETLSKDS
ncbi:DUF4375 domain-containing protein [Verrucomicrobium sp. BvORR106]|uniref:DMP19 family protein n=1 Tax=Verrucomicrobium sp. BvORR106 TaxID=1403819 RepID=UPI0005701D05|nr:DUF4375 domain-containing protein [Verrucomicrobium sp. BvORR106]